MRYAKDVAPSSRKLPGMSLRRGVWLVAGLLSVSLVPAVAQTVNTGAIAGKTTPLTVDFGDTALDSGAKGAIAGKTAPLAIDFGDTALDSGTTGAIAGKTAPLAVDFGDAAQTAQSSGGGGAIRGTASPLVVSFP
jgi:hypothetical protein